MKKTLFIFAVSIFTVIDGNAQNTFPIDTVIHRPSFFTKYTEWDSYNLFDTLSVLQYSSKTLINGISLDSCYNDKDLRQAILYANDMIYFRRCCKSDSISTYSPASKIYKKFPATIHNQNWRFPVDLSKTQLFHDKRDSEPLLQVIDSKTGKESLVADFRPFTDTGEGMRKMSGSIEQVCAIGKFSYIVKTGIWDQFSGDSYVDVKYFKVNNGKINDITNGVTQWIQEQKKLYKVVDKQKSTDELYLHIPSSSNTPLIRGVVMYEGSGQRYNNTLISISVIVDQNLQKVGTVLTMSDFENVTNRIAGINKQKGKIVNYFMYSYLDNDDKKQVIVPYVFSPHLDTLMYNVYHNKILRKEELKDFKKYELGILRNLIFAKYNYAFSSEFYQAYFNLYEFYNDNDRKLRKSRVKNVDSLLTEVDKANIKLLRETEAGLHNEFLR
jgi:hypothetical protein